MTALCAARRQRGGVAAATKSSTRSPAGAEG
jgi:hypothetical protein